MSAFIKQQTVMNDTAVLVEALKNKGYGTVEVCETPQPLVGYQGDFRGEDGNSHTTDENKALKADLIIRRKFVGGASNDIGFRKDEKGNYEAIISQYDSHKHNTQWVQELKQEYGVLKAKKIAKRYGAHSLTQKTLTNGKVHITMKVNG